MILNLQASIVFEKTWKAIHEVDANGERVYDTIVNEGSSRSTKTWSYFQCLYLYAFINRNKSLIVLRDTKEDCRDKVEPEWRDWMRDPNSRYAQLKRGEISDAEYDSFMSYEDLTLYIEENKTHHTYTFKNNSTIQFTGADDETRIIGKSSDVIWINEPYLFSDVVYKELKQRCNDFALIDWNPRTNHWIDTLKLREKTIMIHSTFLDNPFLNKTVKDGLLSAKPLSHNYISEVEHVDLNALLNLSTKDEVRAVVSDLPPKKVEEIVLCWTNEKEKTANYWRWEVYGLGIKSELPNKVYQGWQPITIEEFEAVSASIYYGMDFGLTSPTACVRVKYKDRCLYIDELFYKPGREIASLPEQLEAVGVSKKRPLICDNPLSTEPQKIVELHNAGYSYAIPAYKGKGSVSSGISLIQRCKVYVTKRSTNIWMEYEEYSFGKDRMGTIVDEPIKGKDHSLDAIRMAFNYMQIEMSISI